MARQETKQFDSAFSLLKPSANALLLNLWTFVGLFGVALVFSIISSSSDDNLDSPVMMIFYIISLIAGLILSPAYTIAELQSAQGKKIALLDTIQKGLPFVVRTFFLQILTALVVLVGFILLIVPGVFAIQRLLLSQYYLIDKDMGVIEAMKASAADAKKYPLAVWGLIGVVIAFIFLFFTIILIPLGIALLIAYLCAPAIRYYQLQGSNKKKA